MSRLFRAASMLTEPRQPAAGGTGLPGLSPVRKGRWRIFTSSGVKDSTTRVRRRWLLSFSRFERSSRSLRTEGSTTPWVVTSVSGFSNCIVATAWYIFGCRTFQ